MSKYINLDEAKARTTQLFHGYEVEQWLDTIPSVDIDRPQGEWIEVEEDWRHQIEFWKCSECEFAVSAMYNYCPSCGARMKGADDEIATV